MTEIELLRAAKARILQGWTNKYHAVNAHDDVVAASSPAARAWCAAGAVFADGQNDTADECIRLLESMSDSSALPAWNDAPDRTMEDVVQLFDRAIESLGEPVEAPVVVPKAPEPESSQIDDRVEYYRAKMKKNRDLL